jgi:hypothetical protein
MIKLRPEDKTDPNAPVTLFEIARTSIALDEPGGRFSTSAHVVGTAPTVDYPAASGPWAGADPVGLEPPTGENIEAVEAVGTPAEQAASIERLERQRGGDV